MPSVSYEVRNTPAAYAKVLRSGKSYQNFYLRSSLKHKIAKASLFKLHCYTKRKVLCSMQSVIALLHSSVSFGATTKEQVIVLPLKPVLKSLYSKKVSFSIWGHQKWATFLPPETVLASSLMKWHHFKNLLQKLEAISLKIKHRASPRKD